MLSKKIRKLGLSNAQLLRLCLLTLFLIIEAINLVKFSYTAKVMAHQTAHMQLDITPAP